MLSVASAVALLPTQTMLPFKTQSVTAAPLCGKQAGLTQPNLPMKTWLTMMAGPKVEQPACKTEVSLSLF